VIPTVDDLAADPVTHHYDDMIAPPGLTNLLGTVLVGHDLTAVGAVTFPPVAQGRATTAVLFVDGRVFESYGVPVTHAWRPDRVMRSAELPGLRIETTTVCVPGEPAVAIDVAVHNTGDAHRTVPLTLALNARVTATGEAWLEPEAPSASNTAAAGPARLTFDGGTAWSVQGVDVPGAAVRLSGVPPTPAEGFEVGIGGAGRGGEITVALDLAAGASGRFGYVQAVATSANAAAGAFDRVVADVPAAVPEAEEFWDRQLTAVFTPGNSEFSGHLPVLETSSEALRRLYWWGALGVLWFRRDLPGNVLGRSYDTLMPNYWATTTFIWDFSLSSLTHALLDPEAMRRQLDHWIAGDIHTHFGTSSLTGGPVGRWYSVNDYAMTRLVSDYVRFTGDIGYLSSVGDHLREWATAWQARRKGSALADYGEIDNLLECVSSYTHEVASLNAANVWAMRVAADVADLAGDAAEAQELRAEAAALVPEVLDLYEPGSGFFAARRPDGSRLPVRHCYDFTIVGTTIADDVPAGVRAEMVEFFRRELQTPSWMRALSPWDPDASYSVRPDHQWNGAYPAWPADAARSLVALGAPEVAAAWIEGLARSTNQGPPGQGHFVEEAQPALNGGARKAPPQLPYILDWACSSAGAWVALVIESFFGVDPQLDGTLTVNGCMQLIDPDARLRNLRIGGRLVDVTADGAVVAARG
jgi:mannosylglycerate hydrolase MGH1-like protein